MAVYFPAISISPSYISSTYYTLPSTVTVCKGRRLSALNLGCDGGGDDVTQYVIESRKHWDSFYERHQNKFFKDRHYLEKDWGQYFHEENNTLPSDGKTIFEVRFITYSQ